MRDLIDNTAELDDEEEDESFDEDTGEPRQRNRNRNPQDLDDSSEEDEDDDDEEEVRKVRPQALDPLCNTLTVDSQRDDYIETPIANPCFHYTDLRGLHKRR